MPLLEINGSSVWDVVEEGNKLFTMREMKMEVEVDGPSRPAIWQTADLESQKSTSC